MISRVHNPPTPAAKPICNILNNTAYMQIVSKPLKGRGLCSGTRMCVKLSYRRVQSAEKTSDYRQLCLALFAERKGSLPKTVKNANINHVKQPLTSLANSIQESKKGDILRQFGMAGTGRVIALWRKCS